ncbi:hypothetical protein SAMN05444841_1014 [Enterobacter kobei]|jgi:hypothetical protein|nr:hypothetical protein SAMN05444841_1014 [Enterobacter kobei]
MDMRGAGVLINKENLVAKLERYHCESGNGENGLQGSGGTGPQ